MAKDPAFLFYSSDFLSGITDLTMEERGQYITLLCVQHQKGFLTEKTIRLLVGSVSVDVLSKFSKDSNGHYTNERLADEIIKRNNFTESRRNNGSKGGRPKKNEEKKEKQVNNHMVNHMENENEDDNVDINKVPSFEIFLEYALLHKPLIDEFHLKAKYDSWIGNGWKDGFDTKIKNWKLKLRSTLSFIKEKSKENKHEQLSNITTAIRASNPKA